MQLKLLELPNLRQRLPLQQLLEFTATLGDAVANRRQRGARRSPRRQEGDQRDVRRRHDGRQSHAGHREGRAPGDAAGPARAERRTGGGRREVDRRRPRTAGGTEMSEALDQSRELQQKMMGPLAGGMPF